MIRIRLYREGGDPWNWPVNQKEEEDTCTIVDEQPSTLGEPDFRKVLGYRSP
jgi:hypothetical protein